MRFHRMLKSYINDGCLSASDIVLSGIYPRYPFRKNAATVISAFQQHHVHPGKQIKSFEWKSYFGNDLQLIELMRELDPLKADVLSVVLHGSQADGHTTGYSDVDALVILRDVAFQDTSRLAKVAASLSGLRAHFHQIDPLQHHGWFVMTEKDLTAYPQHVLPLEVLEDARVVFGEKLISLRYDELPASHFTAILNDALNKMERKLTVTAFPHGAFAIKSLLSEFMMLPVLYLQAKTGRGCSKRDSFSLARRDFTTMEWSVMDEVSAIRKAWFFRVGPFSGRILKGTSGFSWKTRKLVAFPLSPALHKRVKELDIEKMVQLVRKMRSAASELSSAASV